jgi:predicted site-specific integrase-resolvase
MEIEIITKQELQVFKEELLEDIVKVLHTSVATQEKEFLRAKEVRQMLGVSNATLQNLRVKRLLNPSKIEGIFYYKLSEIKTLLNAGTKL